MSTKNSYGWAAPGYTPPSGNSQRQMFSQQQDVGQQNEQNAMFGANAPSGPSGGVYTQRGGANAPSPSMAMSGSPQMTSSSGGTRTPGGSSRPSVDQMSTQGFAPLGDQAGGLAPRGAVTNPNMMAGVAGFQGQGFGQPATAGGRTRDGNPGDYVGPAANPFSYSQGTTNPANFLGSMSDFTGMFKPGNWQGDFAGTNGSYMSNFFAPYMNALNATETQNFNEANAQANFGEQQRVNTGQMDLANRDSGRQDLALNYGQQNNVRDFGETQRQFNGSLGLQQQTQDQNYNLGQGQNANTLLNYQNQYKIGNQQNINQANDINNQYSLGSYANQTNRANVANQLALGQGQNANALLNYQNQYRLGQGQLSNDQFANATNRTSVANQMALGQGQLGLGNRTLDTTNAFNRQQLAQQGALTREGFANDTMNQRYQTFGRAQAPNPRALMSWR